MSPTAAPKRAKAPAKGSKPGTAPAAPPDAPRMPPAPAPPAAWAPAPAPAAASVTPPVPPAPVVSRRAPPPTDQGTGAADFFRSTYEVARKEVLQHIRTKRLLIIGLFFLLVLQIVTMVIPLAFDLVKDAPTDSQTSHENQWFFVHLNASVFGGLFAIQLLCIVLTADAVCSEWSGRTIFLLLSKPVSRSAFVVGKYIGSVISIMPVIVGVYILQYLLMMAVYAGQPDASDVMGFVRMLGILVLGAMAIAAVALFFSTLTRSNVLSLMLTLLCALILFPIVSFIGDIQYNVDEFRQARDGGFDSQDDLPDPSDWKYDWSHYAYPGTTLSAAPGQLLPESERDDLPAFSGLLPQHAPTRTWFSITMGLVYTGGLLGLSILRVNRRNFE